MNDLAPKVRTTTGALREERMPATSRTPLLEVRDLTVEIARDGKKLRPVSRVSFSLEAGRTTALIGESGSGKTMIARSLIGLLPAGGHHSGEIRFGGRMVGDDGPLRFADLRGRHIAMIFQHPQSALNPVFQIGHQMEDIVRRNLPMSRRDAREHILGTLTAAGLDEPQRIFRAYPHQLSGGMAQRCMIALALSCRPQLIIADEPTSALDVCTGRQILQLIALLQRQHQFALLLISHDFLAVSALAHQVLVMRSSRIVDRGELQWLQKESRHPYTRFLIDSSLPSFLQQSRRQPQTQGGVL